MIMRSYMLPRRLRRLDELLILHVTLTRDCMVQVVSPSTSTTVLEHLYLLQLAQSMVKGTSQDDFQHYKTPYVHNDIYILQ